MKDVKLSLLEDIRAAVQKATKYLAQVRDDFKELERIIDKEIEDDLKKKRG